MAMSGLTIDQRLKALHRYLDGPFAATKGWCVPQVWQCLEPIIREHERLGFVAPVAEIGPYHGKLFWGLVKSTPCDQGHMAIDIFESGGENPDLSGVRGSLAEFLQSAARAEEDAGSVWVLDRDSRALSAEELMVELGIAEPAFGFFSVDGSHKMDYVLHDLELATALTHRYGVILVDDYCNPRWHGVQEAVARFYLLGSPEFVPLMYSCNKLMLCHMSMIGVYAARVQSFVGRHFAATRVFEVERFGYPGLAVLPEMKGEAGRQFLTV